LRSVTTGYMRRVAEALAGGGHQLDQGALFASGGELGLPDGLLEESSGLSRAELDALPPDVFLTLARGAHEVNGVFFDAWTTVVSPRPESGSTMPA